MRRRCWKAALASQELRVLGWRDVPMQHGGAGRDCAEHDAEDPAGAGGGCGRRSDDAEPMERRLYLARKQFERAVELRRSDGLRVFAVVADDCVQGDVPGRAAAGVLSGPGERGVCDELRDVPSALCDEHAAGVASRAAGAQAGAQRRDQYGVGQSRADGGARIDAAGGMQAGVHEGRNGFDEPG